MKSLETNHDLEPRIKGNPLDPFGDFDSGASFKMERMANKNELWVLSKKNSVKLIFFRPRYESPINPTAPHVKFDSLENPKISKDRQFGKNLRRLVKSVTSAFLNPGE